MSAAALYRHDGAAALSAISSPWRARSTAMVIGEPQRARPDARGASRRGRAGPRRCRRSNARSPPPSPAPGGCGARPASPSARCRSPPPRSTWRATSMAISTRCAALLLGPSEMGELMAEQFRRAGLARLVVCGPAERAPPRGGAARLQPRAASPSSTMRSPRADIVIAALGTGRAVLTPALRRGDVAPPAACAPSSSSTRRSRPMPIRRSTRSTASSSMISPISNAPRWPVGRARGRRVRARPGASSRRSLPAFRARGAARRAVPAVVALRRHFERVRAEVMAERGLDAEAATRLLVNRLLHAPSEALRDARRGATATRRRWSNCCAGCSGCRRGG